jgi:NAD(P)-dependent dehydrogenase (short-subunit alcohol dehydrogenase family)
MGHTRLIPLHGRGEVGILEGKVAVITAAGSGMGKASAEVFAREGARLVVSDISGAEEQTAAEIGGDVVVRHCDVADEAQVAALVQAALDKFGRIDAMLNVAAIPCGAMIEDIDEAHFDHAMNIMLKGVFWGAKHAIRGMKNNGGGTIINWSSVAGIMPTFGASVYSAAKAGVTQLTKSIAIEYGAHNIRANAICPGMFPTLMGAPVLAMKPSFGTINPLGRPGEAVDAGELAAFLASDRANYLNGVIIPLDGGWTKKLAE